MQLVIDYPPSLPDMFSKAGSSSSKKPEWRWQSNYSR